MCLSLFYFFGVCFPGSDEAVCSRKMGRELQVNAMSLQLECACVLHESLLVPVFAYGSETMI